MPRTCSICTRPDAPAINLRLSSGTQITAVAGEFSGTSTSALSRHAKHIAKRVLSESHADTTGTTDLLEVIAEALHDARSVRATALATGNAQLLLRAAQSTESIASKLLERLSPEEDTEVIDTLREGEALARAVAYLARRDAVAGQVLADRLRTDGGHPDLADAILRLIPTTTSQVLETKKEAI